MSDKEVEPTSTRNRGRVKAVPQRRRNKARQSPSSRGAGLSTRCYFSRQLRGRPGLAAKYPFYIQHLEISSGCLPVRGKVLESVEHEIRSRPQRETERPYIDQKTPQRIVACTKKFFPNNWGIITLGGLVLGGALYCQLFGNPLSYESLAQELEEDVDALNEDEGTSDKNMEDFVEANSKVLERYTENGNKLTQEIFFNLSVTAPGGRTPAERQESLTEKKKKKNEENQYAVARGVRSGVAFLKSAITSQEKSTSESSNLQQHFVDFSVEELLKAQGVSLNDHEEKTLRVLLEKYFTDSTMSQVKNFQYKAMYFRLLYSTKLPAYLTLGGHFLANLRPSAALHKIKGKGMYVNQQFQDFVNQHGPTADQNPSNFYSLGLNLLGMEEGAYIPQHNYTQLELLANQLYTNEYIQVSTDDTYDIITASLVPFRTENWDNSDYIAGEGWVDDSDYGTGYSEIGGVEDSIDSSSLTTQSTETPAIRRAKELRDKESRDKKNRATRQSLFAENMEVGKQWIEAGETINSWSKRKTATDSSTGEKFFNVDQAKFLEYYESFREGVIMLREDNPVTQTLFTLQDYVREVIVKYAPAILNWAKDISSIQRERDNKIADFEEGVEATNLMVSKLIETSAYGVGGGLLIAGTGLALGSVAAVPATVIGLGLAGFSFVGNRLTSYQKEANEKIYERMARYVEEDEEARSAAKKRIGQMFAPRESRSALMLPVAQDSRVLEIGDGTIDNTYFRILQEGERYHPTNALCTWELMTRRKEYWEVYCSEWIDGLTDNVPDSDNIWNLLGSHFTSNSRLLIGSPAETITVRELTAETGLRRDPGNTRHPKTKNDENTWNLDDGRFQFLSNKKPQNNEASSIFYQLSKTTTKQPSSTPKSDIPTPSDPAVMKRVVKQGLLLMQATGLNLDTLKERTDLYFKIDKDIQSRSKTRKMSFLENPSNTFLQIDGAPPPALNTKWIIPAIEQAAIQDFPSYATNNPVELMVRYDFYAGTASLMLCLFHPVYFKYFEKAFPSFFSK